MRLVGVTYDSDSGSLVPRTPVEDSWTLCSAFRGGWVGWGNNVHVTSRSSQVEDSWTLCSAFRGGWVGWGNNGTLCSAFRGNGWGGAITFMSRPVHLKLKTPGLYALHSGGDGWGGWGGAITFMSRPVHLKLKTPGLYDPRPQLVQE